MKNIWSLLNQKEKRKILIIIAITIVGIVGTIFFLMSGNFFSFNFTHETGEEILSTDTKENETLNHYKDLGYDGLENEVTEDVLQFLGDFQSNEIKGYQHGDNMVDINTVTALNGRVIENISDITNKDIDDFLQTQGLTKEQYKDFAKNDKLMLYLGFNSYNFLKESYIIGNKNKSEYKFKSSDLDELLELYYNNKYTTVIEKVKSIIDKNSLTNGKNRLIASLYSDSHLMKDFKKLDSSGKISAVKAHKNPLTFAVDTLYLEPRLRETIISDKQSLSPYIEGVIRVESYKRINNHTEDFKKYAGTDSETTNIYEIILDMPDGNKLLCYVKESALHILSIVGYYDYETTSNYRTVQYWIDTNIN